MKTFARYKGNLLNAHVKAENKVLIWGSDPELLKSCFVKDADDESVSYELVVNKTDLEELYDERLYGKWHNVEFEIDGEDENEYTLWFTYHDYKKEAKKIALCESLGMEMYDRNVFYKSVPKSEISSIRTERTDL